MGQHTGSMPHHAREQAHREAHCVQRAGFQGRSRGMHILFMQSYSKDINRNMETLTATTRFVATAGISPAPSILESHTSSLAG